MRNVVKKTMNLGYHLHFLPYKKNKTFDWLVFFKALKLMNPLFSNAIMHFLDRKKNACHL